MFRTVNSVNANTLNDTIKSNAHFHFKTDSTEIVLQHYKQVYTHKSLQTVFPSFMLFVQPNERCCRRWTENIKHLALHRVPSVEYDLLNGTHREIGQLCISVCLLCDKNMFRIPYMNQTTITYNIRTSAKRCDVIQLQFQWLVHSFIHFQNREDKGEQKRKDNTQQHFVHFIRIVNKVSDRCAYNEKLSLKLVIYKNAKVKQHDL